MLLAIACAVQAQTWDTSGNSKLSGTYYFRQVIYVLGDQYGDLSEAVSLYGNITFDGNGHYSLTQNQWVYNDTSSGAGTLSTTGTYSISASGYGFMSNPYTGDSIYGLVSQNGIFVGSSTDNSSGAYNDLLIAAPLASPLPTASTFSGTYVFSDLDLVGVETGQPGGMLSMMFSLTADGACHLSSTIVTGYVGTSATPYTQSASFPTCLFSNGAAVITFPTNGTLIQGQKYLYFSKDGNFVFGGSPYTGYNPWDMIVGVKVASGTPTFSGLFYQAGIDEVGGDLDTYFGSLAATSSGAILGHQRLEDLFGSPAAQDSTYTDTVKLTSTYTYSTGTSRYAVGAGGAIRIGSGIGPYLGLSVALQAPTQASIAAIAGTSVFVNPQGIVNAASWAPFTAGIAPGELLTIYNSANLSADTVVSGIPFPTTLDQVQVSIGGLPAPIYYVSPTQISVVVPYGVTGPIAMIQVTNQGSLSNAVPVFVNSSAAGVFTQNANGLGYGATEHNATGAIVNAASPAVIGETVAVYVTGLGAVTTPIADGAAGIVSDSVGTYTAYIGTSPGTAVLATVVYAGLAPNLSGLYQMDITIPSGLTAGDNYLYIYGPDAYNSQSLIPISTSTGSSSLVPSAPAAVTTPSNHPAGRTKVDPKSNRGKPTPRSAIGKIVQ